MRQACKLAREIIDKAHAAVKPGVTTDELDQIVSTSCKVASHMPKTCAVMHHYIVQLQL